jgi:hypothetical protein
LPFSPCEGDDGGEDLLQNDIGERVADKVGGKWALSDFMFHNWIAKINGIEHEGAFETG